jgi:hypothetical protein
VQKLTNLASITTGIYQKPSPSGDTLYLQGKHFDEDGNLRKDAVLSQELFLDDKLERHLLEDGDVLLMAKGENNRACMYTHDIGQAVASSTFFVVRIKDKQILPAFLQWFLNNPIMQKRLSELARGTHIRSLSKKALVNLEISIPTMEVQEKILVINELWQREEGLTLELLRQKETFYQTILLNQTNRKLV